MRAKHVTREGLGAPCFARASVLNKCLEHSTLHAYSIQVFNAKNKGGNLANSKFPDFVK